MTTFEPTCWLLIFNHHSSTWWRSFLAFGRFKHVWACAFVPSIESWIIYDVHLDGTRLGLVADGQPFRNLMGNLGAADATILRMPTLRLTQASSLKHHLASSILHRLGFWCVPAIKHLIGLRSSALRPDSLYRHCLRHGAQPFEDARGHDPIVPAVAA